MEVSEGQKRRIEANRAAALARRNAKLQPFVSADSLNHVGIPVPHQFRGSHLNTSGETWKISEVASVGHQPLAGQESLPKKVEAPMNAEGHSLIDPGSSNNAGPSLRHLTLVPQLSMQGEGSPKISMEAMGNHQPHVGHEPPGKKLEVILEICAPTKFVLMVKSRLGDQSFCQGFFQKISSVAQCKIAELSQQWPVCNLRDYDKVTESLKGMQGVQYQPIPWPTRMVLENFLSTTKCWVPCRPSHITDMEVEKLLLKLPLNLQKSLLPFQTEGVKYSLRRGGRCLLADEMGVGKTIQAIAMAACYREEGPLLVVCPASMRLVWAEELERWLPFLSPLDVHLVFGRRNDLAQNMQLPKVVVISYFMLARLQRSMLSHKWGMLIVDESHNLRCTTKKVEADETIAVLELARNVKRVVLLSGTPSLSRPFDIFNQVNCLWPELLGKSKYEFARNYCDYQSRSFGQGNSKNFAKGTRLQELNVLLKQTVMVRRLKEDVMAQLPPKRRQVICLKLAPVDIQDAKAFSAATEAQRNSARMGEEACKCGFTRRGVCDCEEENEDENSDEGEAVEKQAPGGGSAKTLKNQEIGVAKLRGFREWLLNNSIFAGRESAEAETHLENTQEKMIIFSHHHKVLDGIQEIVQSKSVELVRVDGTTLAQERLKNVNRFQTDPEVKVAIIGVTAGGVGLNFSAAQSVVFVELPKSASEMLQAEDRAHRRGQKNAVNIYIFCAKETADETHWQSLSRSLERVSAMTDGAEASLEVDSVIDSTKPCIIQESTTHYSGTSAQSKENVVTGIEEIPIVHSSDSFSADSCMTSEPAESADNSEGNSQGKSPFLGSNVGEMPGSCEPGTLRNEDGSDRQRDSTVEFPAASLMFEVSSNTGRIHLFLKSANGTGLPTPLQENFKPEDLTHSREWGGCERGAVPTCLADSAAHREAATSFWEQWRALRPVFRKRLLGRPLSLPLSAELSCLKIEAQYGPGGTLKGGSKRRYTPKEEVGCAPPEGATWKTISFHKRTGLKESQVVQAWSAEGTPLCKFCQQPCEGYRSKKPVSFEDLFCKMGCYDEYSNKTSRRHAREELFNLEGGVCVKCGLDCHALVERMRPLPLDQRRMYILQKAPQFSKRKQMLERLIKDPTEGNAWHADHIVAVADGGGECTLENLQTLCVICHARVTAEQHRRRRSEQMKAKNGLQITIKKLLERSHQNKRIRMCSTEGEALPEASREKSGGDHLSYSSDSEDDKELLDIKVAGSAYSASAVGACTGTSTVDALQLGAHIPPMRDHGCTNDPRDPSTNDCHLPTSKESDLTSSTGTTSTNMTIETPVTKKRTFSLQSLRQYIS